MLPGAVMDWLDITNTRKKSYFLEFIGFTVDVECLGLLILDVLLILNLI